MGEAALTILLKEMEEVLKRHKNLISDSEEELLHLIADLQNLKAAFSHVGIQSKRGNMFRDMTEKVREIVYEVGDTIDNCLTKEVEAKLKSSIRRRLLTSRVRMGTEIKFLRENKVKPTLDIIIPYLDNLGVAGTSSEESPTRPIKVHQSIRQDRFVGVEDELATLIGYFREEKEELDVISIVGMHGLGKTTLARKIFMDGEICAQFPTRIWVDVSQRFNSRHVFLNILKRFTNNDLSGLSTDILADSVRSCLAREKFFIVMDDVWSHEDWTIIQNVLPKSNRLSKVLITSSEKSVGVHANFRTQPHMLRFLRPDESWKLLQLEVFGNKENCPPELEGLGKRIANQCYGVPMIVLLVGGILVDMLKTKGPYLLEEEWLNVFENESKFVQNDKEKRILDVVELSYNRLPEYLRECFLYMAVFPQDHVISAWMLTRLWIAEGFICPKEGKSLEEVAEENLGDLVDRNLLIPDQLNLMCEIKTCRVHDMIRIFCLKRALEQNMFQSINTNNQGVFEPPVSEVPSFQRLSFNSDLTKFLSGKPYGPWVRSFLCFYKEHVNMDARYISTIPEAFNLLRVLESMSIKFHQFPAKVTKLIHLRYVTLHIDSITILPEPLSRLWNLETLVVETKTHSVTMKANIWKMYRLRHLKMKAAIVLDPKWDGEGGENLQSLGRLAPESCAEVSKRACNLKKLGIRGKLVTLFGTMSLENFSCLEKLNLMNDDPHHSSDSSGMHGLPMTNFFPPYLKRLTLSSTFLEWKQMPTLAKINTLEVLKLKKNAFTGIYWAATEDCFPSLRLLLIVNTNLVHWEVSTNSFPSLQCLYLRNCENLNEIPGALATTLEILNIDGLRKSAVDSARRIEKEKHLVQEVENVKLRIPFKLFIGLGWEK